MLEFLKPRNKKDMDKALRLLCGTSSTHLANRCRSVMAPMNVDEVDRTDKVVRVFDPVYTDKDEAMYEAKHMEHIYTLLEYLDEVGQLISEDWSFVLREWDATFNIDLILEHK